MYKDPTLFHQYEFWFYVKLLLVLLALQVLCAIGTKFCYFVVGLLFFPTLEEMTKAFAFWRAKVKNKQKEKILKEVDQ